MEVDEIQGLLRDDDVYHKSGLSTEEARDARVSCGYNVIPAPSALPPWLCCILPCLKQSKSFQYYDLFVPDECCVRRNGKWITIDAIGTVVGDIVRVREGQRVAADFSALEVMWDISPLYTRTSNTFRRCRIRAVLTASPLLGRWEECHSTAEAQSSHVAVQA